MNNKLTVLAVFALSVGLMGNAYAHKEQVVGNYNIEVGWAREPPVVGKPNSIEVMITTASVSDKTASDKMMKEMKGMTSEQVANMDHKMPDSSATKSDARTPTTPATKSNTVKKSTTMSHDIGTMLHDSGAMKTTGVTGLTLDADVTINGKKTMLKLVEDKKTKGRYSAAFTPIREGFPTVHVVGKIKNTPIEVSFHPEKVEKSIKK
jgi:hypothetical protein